MLSGGFGRRTEQMPSLASTTILKSQDQVPHHGPRQGFSRRQEPQLGMRPENQHLRSSHQAIPDHLQPAFLPGFALRVESDVTYSKQSSVTQSTRGQNRLLRPGEFGETEHTPQISKRELTMRRASASRASAPWRTPRGICSSISNRELSTISKYGLCHFKLRIIQTGEFSRG